MLWHLDRGWAEHLEAMNDVRESIHLRALGPVRTHSMNSAGSLSITSRISPPMRSPSRKTFGRIRISADSGVDLAANEMARPTSTWTPWFTTTRWRPAEVSFPG